MDSTGSGGTGLATSTDIADTYVIYGTSADDVGAEAAFTYDDATDKLTVINASTTRITASYASSTNLIAGNFTLGIQNGPLDARNGVVSATTSIGIFYGGTGTTTAPVGQLLYGGASAYQSVATTTATIGGSLLYSGTFGALVGGAAGTLSLNMANANSWTALQSFANASSTLFSNTGIAYFGGSATSTFSSAGVLSLVSNGLTVGTGQLVVSGDNVGIGTTSPYAKLSVVGETVASHFTATSTTATSTFTNFVATGNASTTNLIVSGLNAANCDVKASTAGVLSCGTDAGASFGQAWEIGGNGFAGFLAPTTTQRLWLGQASSTILSAHQTYFGATATSTFSSAGVLTLASALSISSGGTGWAAIQSGSIPYGNGTGALATTTAGTAGHVLALLNGVPTWAATSTLATISGTLSGTQLDGVFSGNGLLARTTTGTYESRTITGTSNQITITNGDGVAGNPTLSFPSLLAFTRASSTQQSILDGLFVGRTATTSIRGDGVASIIPYASTTALTVSGTASTSALIVSGLNAANCDVKSSTAGVFSCGTDSASKWATSTADTLAIFLAGGQRVGIGTTTPRWALQIASSTGPQLALSDTSGTSNPWTFRSINGNLYMATASPSTFATSTFTALTIDTNGNLILGRPLAVAQGGTGTSSATGAAGNLQFLSSAASAVARTYQSKFEDTVSVRDFGAVGDCSTDDRAAIINAIAALGTNGGTVFFPATPINCYAVSNSIYVGDGTASAASTKSNIRLLGGGTGSPSGADIPSAATSTRIKYTGAGTSTLMRFAGPGIFSMENLHIDGNGRASTTLYLMHVYKSIFKSVTVTGFTATGTVHQAYTTLPSGVFTGACDNQFSDFTVRQQGIADVTGVDIGFATPDGNNFDPCRDTWTNLQVFVAADANSEGLILRGTDLVTFTNAFIFSVGGVADAVKVIPPTSFEWLPTNILFINSTLFGAIDTPTNGSWNPKSQEGGGLVFYGFPQNDRASVGLPLPSDPNGNISGFTTTGIPLGPIASTTFHISGKVGIATSSPWAKLSISQFNGGNVPLFAIASSTGSGATSTPLFVSSNGNVGIGTANPDALLTLDNPGSPLLKLSDAGAGVGLMGTADDAIAGGGTADFGITALSGSLLFGSGGVTERMRITSSGNVGIGTTSPASPLTVYGAANYGQVDIVSTSANGESGILFKSADDTDSSGWLVGKNIALTNDSFGIFNGSNRLVIDTAGNVGVGTTSPWRTFSVDGTVSLKNMTAAQAGSVLCLSADNEVTTDSTPASPCSSSLLANKNNVADLSAGLDAVIRLRPVEFDWKDGFGRGHDLGFIAEEVQEAAPILADYNLDGSLSSVKYTQIGALLTKAIQEIASITGTFKSNLIAWLADATNGITDFFAERVHTQELCTKTSDGTEVCASGDQLAAILSAQAGAPSAGGNSEAPAPPAREDADAATSTTLSDNAPIINTTPQAAAGASPIEQSNSTGQASDGHAREAPDGLPAPGAVSADTATNTTPDSPTAVPQSTTPVPPSTSDAAAQESPGNQTQIVADQPPPTEPPPLPPAANDNSPRSDELLPTGTE